MSPVRPLGPASIFTPRKTRGAAWENHPPHINDVDGRGQGVEGGGGERGVGRMEQPEKEHRLDGDGDGASRGVPISGRG